MSACYYCQKDISPDAPQCPKCGEPDPHRHRPIDDPYIPPLPRCIRCKDFLASYDLHCPNCGQAVPHKPPVAPIEPSEPQPSTSRIRRPTGAESLSRANLSLMLFPLVPLCLAFAGLALSAAITVKSTPNLSPEEYRAAASAARRSKSAIIATALFLLFMVYCLWNGG